MTFVASMRAVALGGLVLAVAGCGTIGGWFAGNDPGNAAPATREMAEGGQTYGGQRDSIWSLFGGGDDPNVTVDVNRYIWNASLEVLNFLPIQSVDPFSGVIVTGYGTPPGGGRSYRATVYVQDPALDARSLKVALQGAGGAPVATETVRAVEDAILTRARQLRARDARL